MTRTTRRNPADVFTDLIESTHRIDALDAEKASEVERREAAIREAFALGVTAPALAKVTGLSEGWIKRVVAQNDPPADRRQDRSLSKDFELWSRAFASHAPDSSYIEHLRGMTPGPGDDPSGHATQSAKHTRDQRRR